jgi:hypothetical protein
MKDELYFRLRLTEEEHYIVEDEILSFCKDNDINLKYYRKIKTGHIPMIREVKVQGDNLGLFKAFLKGEIGNSFSPIGNYIVKNEN